ncbi:transposase, partial [Streptomyces antimycoticus]
LDAYAAEPGAATVDLLLCEAHQHQQLLQDGQADDSDELLAFYDFPAEHWIHLRTTNPIESTFATVRLRTKVTRGAGSAAAALAMVFKLVESAQQRWRAVNAPHLVALVRAGARFERDHLVERPDPLAA